MNMHPWFRIFIPCTISTRLHNKNESQVLSTKLTECFFYFRSVLIAFPCPQGRLPLWYFNKQAN
jgi:hypothetical protein